MAVAYDDDEANLKFDFNLDYPVLYGFRVIIDDYNHYISDYTLAKYKQDYKELLLKMKSKHPNAQKRIQEVEQREPSAYKKVLSAYGNLAGSLFGFMPPKPPIPPDKLVIVGDLIKFLKQKKESIIITGGTAVPADIIESVLNNSDVLIRDDDPEFNSFPEIRKLVAEIVFYYYIRIRPNDVEEVNTMRRLKKAAPVAAAAAGLGIYAIGRYAAASSPKKQKKLIFNKK